MVEQAAPSSHPPPHHIITSKSKLQLSEPSLSQLWKTKIYRNQLNTEWREHSLKMIGKVCGIFTHPCPTPSLVQERLCSQNGAMLFGSRKSRVNFICKLSCNSVLTWGPPEVLTEGVVSVLPNSNSSKLEK